MEGPDWKLEDDLKVVSVTFPTNPPVVIKLNAFQVDDMLQNLGEFRANMQPPVAPAFALGQKVDVIAAPAWATEPDAMHGDSLLHVRDPGFGWLHYLLPKADAAKLAEALAVQVAASATGAIKGRAN